MRDGLLSRFRWRGAQRTAEPAANPAFAHLYIVNPLSGRQVAGLFATYPPIETASRGFGPCGSAGPPDPVPSSDRRGAGERAPASDAQAE